MLNHSPGFVAVFVTLVMSSCAKEGPQGTSEDGTSDGTVGVDVTADSTAESTGGSGPTSIAGDGPCAGFATLETCYTGQEVEPGVFCVWKNSAFLPGDAADCSVVELGEGCFPFPSAGGDPGCGPRPGCEMATDFYRPWFKATDEGVVVIETCVGSEPINGFEPCIASDDAEPLACACVCELAP